MKFIELFTGETDKVKQGNRLIIYLLIHITLLVAWYLDTIIII